MSTDNNVRAMQVRRLRAAIRASGGRFEQGHTSIVEEWLRAAAASDLDPLDNAKQGELTGLWFAVCYLAGTYGGEEMIRGLRAGVGVPSAG